MTSPCLYEWIMWSNFHAVYIIFKLLLWTVLTDTLKEIYYCTFDHFKGIVFIQFPRDRFLPLTVLCNEYHRRLRRRRRGSHFPGNIFPIARPASFPPPIKISRSMPSLRAADKEHCFLSPPKYLFLGNQFYRARIRETVMIFTVRRKNGAGFSPLRRVAASVSFKCGGPWK